MSGFLFTRQAKAGSVGGGSKVVRRTSDSATLNTQATPQSDDTLLFAIGVNELWWFEGFLIVKALNTTMDMNIKWSLPASATALWGGLSSMGSTPVAGFGPAATTVTPAALLTEAGTLAVASSNTTYGVSIAGTIQAAGTAGNAVLQWSQATSDAANLQVMTNSWLRLLRFA